MVVNTAITGLQIFLNGFGGIANLIPGSNKPPKTQTEFGTKDEIMRQQSRELKALDRRHNYAALSDENIGLNLEATAHGLLKVDYYTEQKNKILEANEQTLAKLNELHAPKKDVKPDLVLPHLFKSNDTDKLIRDMEAQTIANTLSTRIGSYKPLYAERLAGGIHSPVYGEGLNYAGIDNPILAAQIVVLRN